MAAALDGNHHQRMGGMVAAALVFQCEMFYFGAVRDGRPNI